MLLVPIAAVAILALIAAGYLIAGAIRAGTILAGPDALDDPWNECSDLQGSPRTSARVVGELPVAEILQCHDNEVRDA